MKLMNCTPHKISIQDFITRVTFDVPCSGTTIRNGQIRYCKSLMQW